MAIFTALPGQDPNTSSYAEGVNSLGQVVGTYFQGGSAKLYIWQSGSPVIIQSLTGTPVAINDLGQILISTGDYPQISQNGVITPLKPIANFAGDHGYAYSINNKSQSVGCMSNAVRLTVDIVDTILWQGTNPNLVHIDGGLFDDCGRGVNDSGAIAGRARTTSYLWEAGATTKVSAGDITYANAINNLRQIVGGFQQESWTFFHPFLWQSGVSQDLHPPGSSTSVSFSTDASGRVTIASDIGGWIWKSGTFTHLDQSAGLTFVSYYSSPMFIVAAQPSGGAIVAGPCYSGNTGIPLACIWNVP